MQASGYLKDNRLLPGGLDPARALESVRPVGQSSEDPDFFGGEDSLQYAVDLGEAPRPLTVTVELLFQSIGYRWAENLREWRVADRTVLRFSARCPSAGGAGPSAGGWRFKAAQGRPVHRAAAARCGTPAGILSASASLSSFSTPWWGHGLPPMLASG
jgi:hypothetical protein